MCVRFGLILLLAVESMLAGCAILDQTPPDREPSVIASGYIGKPLNDLEMHWSVPWTQSSAGERQSATWRFDQYNLAGCTVTVRTDTGGIIRHVEWTRGCGPKGTGTEPTGGFDSP